VQILGNQGISWVET